MISRDEVHGGKKRTLWLASAGYAVVCLVILLEASLHGRLIQVNPYMLVLLWLIMRPLFRAIGEPSGPNIGKAVKGGIIGLIAMNAAWVAAFAIFPYPLIVLAFLPLSFLLARAFAVT